MSYFKRLLLTFQWEELVVILTTLIIIYYIYTCGNAKKFTLLGQTQSLPEKKHVSNSEDIEPTDIIMVEIQGYKQMFLCSCQSKKGSWLHSPPSKPTASVHSIVMKPLH